MNIPLPPLILGERPTPTDPSSYDLPTFRQIPIFTIDERLGQSLQVRKGFYKYLQNLASISSSIASNLSNTTNLQTIERNEIQNSELYEIFHQLQSYENHRSLGYANFTRQLNDLILPFKTTTKVRKWKKEAYQSLQRTINEIHTNEKKLEKYAYRLHRMEEEYKVWEEKKKETNEEGTIENKLQTLRDEIATIQMEMKEAQRQLQDRIYDLDHGVLKVSELSQLMEEDRIDSMAGILKRVVELKRKLLMTEIQELNALEEKVNHISTADRAVQKYIEESKRPKSTHPQHRALVLVDWYEEQWKEKAMEEAKKEEYISSAVFHGNVTPRKMELKLFDIEVIKDFVLTCLKDPDTSIVNVKAKKGSKRMVAEGESSMSYRYRSRFCELPSAMELYRHQSVRNIIVQILNYERQYTREVTKEGYEMLSKALWILLDVSQEENDMRTIQNIMNLALTFHIVHDTSETSVMPYLSRSNSAVSLTNKPNVLLRSAVSSVEPRPIKPKLLYLQKALILHPIWKTFVCWRQGFLSSIGDELHKHFSRMEENVKWYLLTGQQRIEQVVDVHTIISNQVISLVSQMHKYKRSRLEIEDFICRVFNDYELGEEQEIELRKMVRELKYKRKRDATDVYGGSVWSHDNDDVGGLFPIDIKQGKTTPLSKRLLHLKDLLTPT